MEYDKSTLPEQTPTSASGESIWDLFWYVIKWVFFVFLIYMGMKYFYDLNRKKQQANKLQDEKESEKDDDQSEDED